MRPVPGTGPILPIAPIRGIFPARPGHPSRPISRRASILPLGWITGVLTSPTVVTSAIYRARRYGKLPTATILWSYAVIEATERISIIEPIRIIKNIPMIQSLPIIKPTPIIQNIPIIPTILLIPVRPDFPSTAAGEVHVIHRLPSTIAIHAAASPREGLRVDAVSGSISIPRIVRARGMIGRCVVGRVSRIRHVALGVAMIPIG